MWYDIFKLFWYAFMKEPQHKEGGIICGPFIPDIRHDAIPDIRDMNIGFTSNACQHPNAYYHGDTCPVTYKCPDCGATFYKVTDQHDNA